MAEEPAVAEEGTPPPEAAPPPTTAASNADIGSSAGGSAALESQADDVGTSELEMQEEGGAKSSSEEEDDEEGGDTLGELAGVRSPRTQAELEKSSAQPAAAPAPLSDDEQARRRMSITSQSMADQAAAMAAAVAAHGAVETKPVNKDAVLWMVSLNAILVTAANTIYIPGFKQVEDDLNTTTAMVTLTVTSYTIGQAIQPLVSGPLADSKGRRGPMLAAHACFLTASILCALSPTITFLVIARVFQAIGGCTFLIVGQAQVGDVFPRAELSEALAFFSLSRTFAAMVGPITGGLLCELLGWRWTFWFCAAADAVLFIGSIVYVPETLAIPPEARPKLKLTSMFKPLTELRHKEVGLMCLLGGVNHGVLYVTMITIPQIMALLTDDEFVIGLMMMPLVAGTLVGSKLAGKLARPVDQNPSDEERAKIPLWEKKSFLRTWFPWSVCGPRCQSLAPEGGDPKKDTVRFVGFRIPALGEWPAILIGICLSLSMAATFGWFSVLFCHDGKMIPIANDTNATGPAGSWDGAPTLLPVQHEYDPLDTDDLMYRLNNDVNGSLRCESWNWWAIVCQWISGFIMCTNAMMVVVGSATYLSVNRPESRSSVAGAQRSMQMVFAAITLSIGGSLFEKLGPHWMHTVLSGCAALFIPTMCCVDRDPTPKAKEVEAAPMSPAEARRQREKAAEEGVPKPAEDAEEAPAPAPAAVAMPPGAGRRRRGGAMPMPAAKEGPEP